MSVETRPDIAAATTGPLPARRRNPRSHQAILQAAIDLLGEVGYTHLTIEGVAARARVGKATVYRWWPSKAALVIDAVDQTLEHTPVRTTGDSRTDVGMLIQSSSMQFLASRLTRLPMLRKTPRPVSYYTASFTTPGRQCDGPQPGSQPRRPS